MRRAESAIPLRRPRYASYPTRAIRGFPRTRLRSPGYPPRGTLQSMARSSAAGVSRRARGLTHGGGHQACGPMPLTIRVCARGRGLRGRRGRRRNIGSTHLPSVLPAASVAPLWPRESARRASGRPGGHRMLPGLPAVVAPRAAYCSPRAQLALVGASAVRRAHGPPEIRPARCVGLVVTSAPRRHPRSIDHRASKAALVTALRCQLAMLQTQPPYHFSRSSLRPDWRREHGW